MEGSKQGRYERRRAARVLLAAAAVALVALGARLGAGVPSADASVLSDAEVVARAVRFLRMVGSAAADKAPTSVGVDRYRSDAREVLFAPELTRVLVHAETGRILGFVDFTRNLTVETGQRISEQQAIALAKRYLAELGVTLQDATFKSAGFSDVNDGQPPIQWGVTWNRMYKGFEVSGDSIVVMVDGQTGALVGFQHNFASRMPPDVTPRVSAEQAAAIARNYSGWQPTGEARLIITSYGFPQREDRCAQETRLTWDVRMEGRRAVFVDAVTGEPVGEAAPMGRAEPPILGGAGSQNDPFAPSFMGGAAITAAALAAAVVVAWLLRGLAVKRARTARTSGSVPPASGPG